MNKLKIEYIKAGELIKHKDNVRKHNKKQIDFIKSSISKYGFVNPVIVDDSNVILAGHGRVESVEADTLIPCVRVNHLNDDDKKSFLIDENYSYDLGEWNKKELENKLKDNSKSLLKKLRNFEIEKDLLNRKNIDINTINDVVKYGDVWQIGRHLLICSDSKDINTYKKINNKIDMVFTSPPYNQKSRAIFDNLRISKKIGIYDKHKDNMPSNDYINFLCQVLNNIETVLNKRHCVVWNSCYSKESRYEFLKVIINDKHNFYLMETIGWNKIHANNLLSNNIFTRVLEFIFVLSLDKKDYLTQQDRNIYKNLIDIDVSTGNKDSIYSLNTATFPIKLVEHFIKLFCKENMYILDCFCGLGSTLYACQNMNVNGIGIELSEKQCSYIIQSFKEKYNIDSYKIDEV